MFTKIFKSDYIFQLIFILIVSIVLFIYKLNIETTISDFNQSPISHYFNTLVSSGSLFIVILNFSLLVFQSLLFKRVLSSNDLTAKGSLLSSFLYIITIPCFVNFHIVQPILFTNLLLIIVLNIILPIYSKPESYENVFNSGALISLASLIYIPSAIFIIFIFFAFLVYSLFKWREWIISIIGFITPYIIYFGLVFLTDNLKSELNKYQVFFKTVHIQSIAFNNHQLIFIISIGILFIISTFYTLNKLSERSIYFRKKTNVFLMFFMCSLTTFIFPSDLINNHVAFILIPAIYFLSTYISQIKNIYISESLYLIIISAVIYNLL